MPFTFKLSQRLARMRSGAVVVTIAALSACEKPIAVATDPGGTPASQLVVSPRAVTLHTNQTVDLTAVGLTAIGDTAAVAVTWSVTTGSVIDTSTSGGKHYGRYKAGTDTGTVKVVANGHPGTTSDTSVVIVTAAPVAAVTLNPSAASVFVGQSIQLGATTTDSVGNVLSGRTVTWTSSNPAVATVNGSGLASAVSIGSATITATSEGQSGTAAISVSNVPVATVTVSPASASMLVGQTVQLAATTRDASGNVLSGRSIVWTSNNGSVATVNGSGLVTGVTAGSGTITATSEGQSGSAAMTVTSPPPPPPAPVASVTVSPASASVGVGGTQQYTATLKDAGGNVLTGRTVTWTSSVLSVATISGSGLVTALLAGTSTITATSEGQSGSAALTVTALPPPSGWPNEPSGLSVWSDYGFGTAIPVTASDVPLTDGSGWSSIYNGNGLGSIGNDPAAPASPPAVFQLKYPVGFTGGASPSTLYHNLPNVTQVYAGFWWKPSSPWQGHASNVNKIAFLFPGNNGDMYIAMYGPPGGPYELRVLPEFPGLPVAWYVPNVTHVAVGLGQWHRIEWWVDKTAGVLRWWLDGQLIGDYSGVAFPSGGFSLFEFSSTWGGIGDSKTETDYYWFDHVHLSGH